MGDIKSSSSTTFPLVTRALDQVLVFQGAAVSNGTAAATDKQVDNQAQGVSESSAGSDNSLGQISVGVFLGRVQTLAQALPEGSYAINLCNSRYYCLLAFCAVILRRQTNLLPPNKNQVTQQALCQRYGKSYILHDGVEIADGLANFDLRNLDYSSSQVGSVPQIPLDQMCAIAFTSGSTGESKPNFKTWNTLVESSRINARYMFPDASTTVSMLATVPGQHMWGLETSILLPLFANLAITAERPLYPKDIQTQLAQLPAPRILVTTPVHLRAMTASDLVFPKVERVLCATAPLQVELARATEQLFGGEVREIFGCSEVGSMAFRRTVNGEPWCLFEGIKLTQMAAGTIAKADHLPEPVQLQDLVEMSDDRHFQLCGRHSDMIEIAGKRGSIQEINQVLMTAPGVLDGVVFYPEQQKSAVGRLAALVVMVKGANKSALVSHFRNHLDSAFIPRPIHLVDALPRQENGKLAHHQVRELHARLMDHSRLMEK